MDEKEERERPGITKGLTRRGFLTSMGAGAIALGTPSKGASAETPTSVITPQEMAKIELVVDGRRHRLLVEPRWSLVRPSRKARAHGYVKWAANVANAGLARFWSMMFHITLA